MSKYKILWIDDQYELLSELMERCELIHNFEITKCRFAKEGMTIFKEYLEDWSAVVLDAKVLFESMNEIPSTRGLSYCRDCINEFKAIRSVPTFIFTGQPDLFSNELFENMVSKYYIKGDDEDQLIADIIIEADKLIENQIIHKYQDIYDSLKTLGISEYTKSIILDILLSLHYTEKQSAFRPIHHYNQLRQLVEYLFRVCHRVGLVPDQCIPNGIVNLNQCSIYLAGKNAEIAGVRYGVLGERVIPEYIEAIIRSVLDFGNIHSHTVELDNEDTIKVENILKSAQSKYLIFGLTLQMCEVIIWFANYINTHNDKEVNLLYCQLLANDENKSKYEGKDFIVEKDEQNNYHCDQCRLSYKIAQHYKGKIVTLYEVVKSDPEKNSNYTYFAKRFELKE